MFTAENLGIRRPLYAMILCALVFSMSLQTATAKSANIPAGDVHFERRAATSNSKLSWQWNSSGTLVFSVARDQNPGALLFSREGTEESGSVTVPSDDTYLLLWFNPGNITVALNYSSTVEAGTGSAFLFVTVVLVLVGIFLFALIAVRRRHRLEEGDGQRSDGRNGPAKPEMSATIPPPLGPPQSHPPPPPPPAVSPPQVPLPVPYTGSIFCRRCGRPSSQESVFCADCGYPLG